jgi:hypothetical protein
MFQLPFELQERILLFTDFRYCLNLDYYSSVTKKLFDSEIHTWEWAAKNGFLEVVIWLQQFNIEGCTNKTYEIAAENGHLHILKWLHLNRKNGYWYIGSIAICLAIGNRHYEVAEWIYFVSKMEVKNGVRVGVYHYQEAEIVNIMEWVEYYNHPEYFIEQDDRMMLFASYMM